MHYYLLIIALGYLQTTAKQHTALNFQFFGIM